jgi:hypothetical protein
MDEHEPLFEHLAAAICYAIQVRVSPPLVSFRETILAPTTTDRDSDTITAGELVCNGNAMWCYTRQPVIAVPSSRRCSLQLLSAAVTVPMFCVHAALM